jgi:hypothetical protein
MMGNDFWAIGRGENSARAAIHFFNGFIRFDRSSMTTPRRFSNKGGAWALI